MMAASPSHADAAERVHQSEQVEQPHHNCNDNHNVEDALDLAIHRDVVIDEPQQDSNNNESDNQ